eukprot:COSAG02_NODE_281_length_25776_cov_37.797998_5_plen_255_part_00
MINVRMHGARADGPNLGTTHVRPPGKQLACVAACTRTHRSTQWCPHAVLPMPSQGRRRLARILTGLNASPHAASTDEAETVTIENSAISVTVALHGGFILSVCPAGRPDANPVSNRHFICCDRWGPASKAEQQEGMTWHGEAMRENWTLDSYIGDGSGSTLTAATMSVELPMAGLTVTRRLKLVGDSPVLLVEEDVTNKNSLGRVYNLVQHPTLGTTFYRPLQAHVMISPPDVFSPGVVVRVCSCVRVCLCMAG